MSVIVCMTKASIVVNETDSMLMIAAIERGDSKTIEVGVDMLGDGLATRKTTVVLAHCQYFYECADDRADEIPLYDNVTPIRARR